VVQFLGQKGRQGQQAKDADKPEPKGKVTGHFRYIWECTDRMLPVERLGLTRHVLILTTTIGRLIAAFKNPLYPAEVCISI